LAHPRLPRRWGSGLFSGRPYTPSSGAKSCRRKPPGGLAPSASLVAPVRPGSSTQGSNQMATENQFAVRGTAAIERDRSRIVFGVITIFVAIPNGNIIYCVLGLVVFGAFTIFDFNRLRRANPDVAVPIAASIFLDIFNVFLFFLSLFGGGGRR